MVVVVLHLCTLRWIHLTLSILLYWTNRRRVTETGFSVHNPVEVYLQNQIIRTQSILDVWIVLYPPTKA
jgi:hypothetical protein